MDGATRIVALINQKGGVGKTTTTVNLAAAVADSGRRVLVVDLDPQAHASLHLGVDPSGVDGSVYDILADSAAKPAIRQVRTNLWLLPSETDLAAAEADLATMPDRARRLDAALRPIASGYDVVMIDCPPSLGLLTLNGLVAAREVFIPMQPHFLALQGVGKLLETVRLVAQTLNPRLRVSGIILCMHDSTTTHAQEVVADIEQFFELSRAQDVPWNTARVFHPPIRRNIKLAECPSFGKTIFDYAPNAAGAADYKVLAANIVRHWSGAEERRVDPAPMVTVVAGAPGAPTGAGA